MFRTLSAILFIVSCLISIIVLSVFYSLYDDNHLPNDYAIVFDAGSSGTRMYLYEWKANFSAAKGDDLKLVEKLKCKVNDNGISTYKNDSEVKENFSPCIQNAKSIIPNTRLSRTYIFLAATAGMRLLEFQDKKTSDKIIESIRSYFKSTNLRFTNESQVRVLSGQEEGINAWISANYYTDSFKHNEVGSMLTSGVLDLGGASTQITFVPKDSNIKNAEYFSSIRIYGVEYKPYSYSFLCWGQNELKLLSNTYSIWKSDYQQKLFSSCLPRGFTKLVDSNQLIESPCTNGLVTQTTLNFTKDSSKIQKDNVYEIEGQSNFVNCVEDVKKLLPENDCKYDSCSFNGVYIPKIDQSKIMITSTGATRHCISKALGNSAFCIFKGFSGFWYALDNTGKLFKKEFVNNYEDFRNATRELCSMTYDQLLSINSQSGANLPVNFLTEQCLMNNYVIHLLESYGINSFNDLSIQKKVNGFSLNWALGYMINELNRNDFLPYEKPPRKIKLVVYLPITIILCLMTVFVSLGLVYYRMRYGKQKDSPEILEERSKSDNILLNVNG